MVVAVFGGSFNPPHVGHAMVAAWALWTEVAEEVWLVPAYAHAFGKQLAPFAKRTAACGALAAMLGPRVRVETIESTLPAPSYTIHTLDALAARHPGVKLRLLLGADNQAHLAKWRDWPRIAQDYEPIFVGRGNAPVAGVPSFPDVSSSEVRRRLAAGESVDSLVPAAVLREWCRED